MASRRPRHRASHLARPSPGRGRLPLSSFADRRPSNLPRGPETCLDTKHIHEYTIPGIVISRRTGRGEDRSGNSYCNGRAMKRLPELSPMKDLLGVPAAATFARAGNRVFYFLARCSPEKRQPIRQSICLPHQDLDMPFDKRTPELQVPFPGKNGNKESNRARAEQASSIPVAKGDFVGPRTVVALLRSLARVRSAGHARVENWKCEKMLTNSRTTHPTRGRRGRSAVRLRRFRLPYSWPQN
jgi:hypothetical protein